MDYPKELKNTLNELDDTIDMINDYKKDNKLTPTHTELISNIKDELKKVCQQLRDNQ
jgi:hypothetical protein